MTADRSLSGRHALVCGASAGLGRAAAGALADRGARVTVLARRAEALDEVVAELGEGASRVVADLDERDQLGQRIDALLADRGPVHVLVNNTGGPPAGPLLDFAGDTIAHHFARHLLSFHLLVQKVLPGMQAAGWGRIVNVLSVSAREPIDSLGLSNLIRPAVAGWAKTLSRELPPGITINNVLPGYMMTSRLEELRAATAERTGQSEAEVEAAWAALAPEDRVGDPSELADAIAFLCSPSASYVRGVSLPVDGGLLRSI